MEVGETVVTVELEPVKEVVQATPATEEGATEDIKGVMAAEMVSTRQQAGKR